MPSDGEGMPLGRLKELRDLGVDTGIWWYADHPSHYCGDGRPATAEKGEKWFAAAAQALAHTIRVIKADREAGRLQDEFFGKMKQHS
jgi:creatinine amidohydrolase